MSAPRQAKPRSSPRGARDRCMPRAPPGRPWWGEARVPAPEDPRSGRWRTSGRDEDLGRGAFAGPVPGRRQVRPPDETPRRWSRSASNSTKRSPNSRPSSPATSARPPFLCPGRRRTPTVALGPRRRPRWLDLAAIPAEIVAPSGWRTTPAHRRLDRPRDPIDLGSDITVRRNDRVRGDGYTVVWAYSLVRALSRERPCLRHPGRAGRQARGQVNNSRLPNEPSQQRSPNNWHRSVSGMAPMSESAAGDR